MLPLQRLVMLAVFVTAVACTPPNQPRPTPDNGWGEVWILSPESGEVIPVGTSHTISFKAASFQEVAAFEFTYCSDPNWIHAFEPENTGEGGADGTYYFADFPIASDEAGPCDVKVRAVATDSESESTPWVQVHFFYGQAPVLVTPGIVPLYASPTNTLTQLKPPIFTPTESGSWQAAAVMNANCRAGPGTGYNEWGYALKGDVVEVVGRNEDGTWLNVLNPHASGKCWLSLMALDLSFDANAVPVASYPTPPAPDEGGPSLQACWVRSDASGATVCVAPCPAGASPGTACTP